MQKVSKTPINLKKIDKILKRASKTEKLVDGMLAQVECPWEGEKGKCKTTGRCAIGELLFRAGFKDSELATGQLLEGSSNSKAAKALKKEYGIPHSIVYSIEGVNDNTDTENRYENVMAFITFAEVMRQQGIAVKGSSYLEGFYGSEYDVDTGMMVPVDVPLEAGAPESENFDED